MNFAVVLVVIAILAFILILLGMWQRKIDSRFTERALGDLGDAERRGTNKPLAQHPQIDVQSCIGCGSCVAACPEEKVLGLVGGVAAVIHASRCIGHGLCADACPVAAISIGLGEVAKRPDLPVLSDDFETSVPGMYIAGELGGFALIRIAVEQGTRAVREIAASLREEHHDPEPGVLDVLIVGAGPAGFAASLEATKHGLTYLTIDQQDIGGTVRKYPRRKLTLTGELTLPLYGKVERTEFLKEELIEFWEEIAARFSLQIRSGTKLLGVGRVDGMFAVETSEGTLRARRVVLALGRCGTPRKLGVPGEESEKVLYQLIDTATYNDQRILVVGGGDSAVEAATGLANQPGNVVTLSYRREHFFRLKSRNEERIRDYSESGRVRVLFQSNVKQVDEKSVTLAVRDGDAEKAVRFDNDYVFVFAGGEPPYPLLAGAGIRCVGDAEAKPKQLEAVR